MAARRGKTQARRNHGQGGLPGWAWMVLGIVLTVAAVLLAPKWLKSDGDGLWRPQPNPDARPARAADAGDEAVDAPSSARPRPATPSADEEGPEYDFYTLLPGKEVALSDSELAATERAEAQRLEAQRQAQSAQAAALPAPVDGQPVPATKPVARAPVATAAAPADGASYLLQAGAFQASGQAEELKARIALLGLGARVESAQIGDKTIYRVRMGPYGTASDLAEAKRKLASGGLPAMAIKVK
ncbi:MAG TPA: SPOR domain-containing protein [Lysobacter sp.]|nr:SPOR domain-containing protein [Lysobacter sp.]